MNANRNVMVGPVQLRAATINEDDRSVEATVATENAVRVVDVQAWETIDEVLLMEGAQFPDQARLFPNHKRGSLDDIMGSVREFQVQGSELRARLYLAKGPESSPEERAWSKIRQGHIDSVSVGYTVEAHTDVPAGKSSIVDRKRYDAAEDTKLRISTRWRVKEVSLVGIGADDGAKIRAAGVSASVPVQLAATLRELIERRGSESRSTNEIHSDMCGAAGISQSMLARILCGEIRFPSLRMLERFALVLDAPLEMLTRAAASDGLAY